MTTSLPAGARTAALRRDLGPTAWCALECLLDRASGEAIAVASVRSLAADLGVAGAITTKSRRTGGTDHTSFNAAGLPGIGTQLDPMEYQTHTWHTNLDTYERIVEEDVKAQAAVIAALVYELAMRDELLPRFAKDQMPRAEPTPQERETPAPTPTAGQ